MAQEYSSSAAITGLLARRKPFPGIQLIRLYLNSNGADTYCDYYAGFKLLRDWLSPLDWKDVIPVPIVQGLGSYDIQELAKICYVSQNIIYGAILEIYYGRAITSAIANIDRSKTEATLLQQHAAITFLPSEIPAI